MTSVTNRLGPLEDGPEPAPDPERPRVVALRAAAVHGELVDRSAAALAEQAARLAAAPRHDRIGVR